MSDSKYIDDVDTLASELSSRILGHRSVDVNRLMFRDIVRDALNDITGSRDIRIET